MIILNVWKWPGIWTWLDNFKLHKKMVYLQFGAGMNVQSHPDIPNKENTYPWYLKSSSCESYGHSMLDKNLTNLDTNLFPHVPASSVIDCKLPHLWVSSSGQNRCPTKSYRRSQQTELVCGKKFVHCICKHFSPIIYLNLLYYLQIQVR